MEYLVDLVRIDPLFFRKLVETLKYAVCWSLGCRENLVGEKARLFRVIDDKIGERSTDVDADQVSHFEVAQPSGLKQMIKRLAS